MDLMFLLALLIALEIFESNWQKADTLFGVLKNNYLVYKKGLFLYFLLNSTVFYSIFLTFFFSSSGASGDALFWLAAIVIMKFLDMIFRLHIMKKIDNDEDINEIIPMDVKMTLPLRYMNVLIYPTALLFAIVNL